MGGFETLAALPITLGRRRNCVYSGVVSIRTRLRKACAGPKANTSAGQLTSRYQKLSPSRIDYEWLGGKVRAI